MELAGLEPATSWVRHILRLIRSGLCRLLKRFETLSVLGRSLSLVAR
jgi:hypothetical protein